ncbi:MAG TPA: sulfite exporter TauE/SafE family protein [Solimonas sp.]|nr:sulfite exporter TauE/SafE family protein [Solimonas sp.]
MDQLLHELPLFLLTGAAAGVLAGLFGVGGGLVMVPALALLLPARGYGEAIYMQVAIGTSLAVISLTSLSSTRAHHVRGGVAWPTFRRLAPGLALGALAGAQIADRMSGQTLKHVVGAGALLVALQMAFARAPGSDGRGPTAGPLELFGAGGVIGALSALVGIGGGSLTVPYLSWRGLPIRHAVGTAAACGVPIAWAGALGFVIAGWDASGLPPWSLGYVSLTGFAGLAAASVAAAPLGARLAHRLPPPQLKRGFALLLFLIGLKMILG